MWNGVGSAQGKGEKPVLESERRLCSVSSQQCCCHVLFCEDKPQGSWWSSLQGPKEVWMPGTWQRQAEGNETRISTQ